MVKEWLADNEVDASELSYTAAEDWITVTLPISKVESLLDTESHVYGHEDGSMLVRTPEWSLPRHLHDHIDTIQPTNSFFRASPKARAMKTVKTGNLQPGFHRKFLHEPTVEEACNVTGITPLCLRTLYGTLSYKVSAAGKNKVGLNDFLGESNNRSDTHIFLEELRPKAAHAAYDFTFDVFNNGPTYQGLTAAELAAGTEQEGDLDVQTILGIDYPTPLIAFTTGGEAKQFKPDVVETTDENEPYLAWLHHVLKKDDGDIPQTISTSYDDDEQTVPPAFARRVCKDMAQLGARGVSLFFAAGDSGVGPNGQCISNNGTNAPTFIAQFPSTCPYVTSVGATKNFNPEVVAYDSSNGFSGGGGFSSIFARPSYQDNVVPQYVASLNGEFAPYYNSSGRGYPDISAQGQRFITIWNGSLAIEDGTSASTPAAAAVFALVNDALIAAGRPPMGFLNPWRYSGGYQAFTDITSGSAIGCKGRGAGLGVPATTGWDAASGFCTPQFKAILDNLGVQGNFKKKYGGFAGYYDDQAD